ncbi:MAG: T9SS type A sorting domain-containing protein [Bacteroidota bacterium]
MHKTYKFLSNYGNIGLVVILFLVGISTAYSQQFAPVGSTWTYQTSIGSGLPTIFQFRTEKDTVIDDRYCTIITPYLLLEDGTWQLGDKSEIVSSSENGDTVYVRIENDFGIIYDFTAEVGDTIVVTDSEFYGFFGGVLPQRRFVYKIDSISSVPFNGDTLLVQYSSYLSPPNDTLPEWGFGDQTDIGSNTPGRIVKGVGSLNRAALLGTSSGISFLANGMPDYLNCYEDEEKSYGLGSIDCDSLISLYTSVYQEIRVQEDEIIIHPNPFTEFISITHDLFEVAHIRISDIQGRTLKTSRPDTMTNIDLSHLLSGVYFVTLSFRNGNRKTYQIVRK